MNGATSIDNYIISFVLRCWHHVITSHIDLSDLQNLPSRTENTYTLNSLLLSL